MQNVQSYLFPGDVGRKYGHNKHEARQKASQLLIDAYLDSKAKMFNFFLLSFINVSYLNI